MTIALADVPPGFFDGFLRTATSPDEANALKRAFKSRTPAR
jgi:hypothetical protein